MAFFFWLFLEKSGCSYKCLILCALVKSFKALISLLSELSTTLLHQMLKALRNAYFTVSNYICIKKKPQLGDLGKAACIKIAAL